MAPTGITAQLVPGCTEIRSRDCVNVGPRQPVLRRLLGIGNVQGSPLRNASEGNPRWSPGSSNIVQACDAPFTALSLDARRSTVF